MNFIEEKLNQLQAIEDAIDSMPPGDERAEKVVMVERARKEIMQIAGGSREAEGRLDKIINPLTNAQTSTK